MLFAYELIEPSGFVWQSRVDFSRLPQRDRAAAKAQLRSLLNIGIYGLGKTKASASVQTKLGVSSACNSKELSDGLVAITLQSATLLCDPKRLTKASGSDELHAAYGDVWHDLSLGSLELQRYFAKLSLAGGFYLHRRFRKGEPYAPWLLTEPGSVFLFRKLTPQAEQLISNWQNEGLPLPSWAISRYTRASLPGNHWSNCPYIPENGYGEIMVNLDAHQERRIP
jgi:hypothetical protein